MMKPVVGHATLKLGSEADPLPAWREALPQATPEAMIKLLVDISAWAQRHPKSADAWTLLGDAYLKVKQPYAAEKAFRGALSVNLSLPGAREGLGLALMEVDRLPEAAKHLAIAHKLDPNNAEILVHWGQALFHLNHLKAAHQRFQMAVERNPDNAQAWLNLGVVDLQRDKPSSALPYIQKALQLAPSLGMAHHQEAMAYRALDLMQKARTAAERAIETSPNDLNHVLLLADIQLDAGWLEQADTTLKRAMSTHPTAREIHLRRARMFKMQGQYSDALGTLVTAAQLGESEAVIQLATSEIELLSQDWAAGWDHYEARKHIQPSPVRAFPFPEWDGSDPAGLTVLVHAEQGLGSTILFAQCLPDLIQRAGHVVIEVPTELAALMQRSFPEATVVGRHPRWDTDNLWMENFKPAISRQIAIGSLPRFFRRNSHDFPTHTMAYLKPDPARVVHWREQLSKDGPAIGLAWSGGLPQTGRNYRSVPLATMASLVKQIPCRWVSLQHDAPSSISDPDAKGLEWSMQVQPEVFKSMDELAALTCALDLVVTVSGTQAHLCGALGRPAFVLTPAAPAWPYGRVGPGTVWHPSLTLIRQTKLHDWTPALDELASKLSQWTDQPPRNPHVSATC